jgi:hypothetical protein
LESYVDLTRRIAQGPEADITHGKSKSKAFGKVTQLTRREAAAFVLEWLWQKAESENVAVRPMPIEELIDSVSWGEALTDVDPVDLVYKYSGKRAKLS